MSFAAAFEYEVEPAAKAAFEAVYGGAAHYLVIDRWRSESAYDAFLAAQGPEYRRRNEEASRLYLRERILGRFDVR